MPECCAPRRHRPRELSMSFRSEVESFWTNLSLDAKRLLQTRRPRKDLCSSRTEHVGCNETVPWSTFPSTNKCPRICGNSWFVPADDRNPIQRADRTAAAPDEQLQGRPWEGGFCPPRRRFLRRRAVRSRPEWAMSSDVTCPTYTHYRRRLGVGEIWVLGGAGEDLQP